MNFQNLSKIENYKFYLDTSFRNAREKVSLKDQQLKRKYRKNPNKYKKEKERMRIRLVQTNLNDHLNNILRAFPEIDDLTPFYNDLVKATIEYSSLKKSLGALNWARKKIKEMTFNFDKKIVNQEAANIDKTRKEYFGRISSIMRQIKDNLFFLDEARKIMRDYPTIKNSLFTIAIFGFPNVGKTTLLYKLTGSKPEINSYSFTTKKLNVGYLTSEGKRVQIIDTPGSLNRFENMNPIEKQAELCLKHCADIILYVFDPTEPYPLKEQKKLFQKIRKLGKDYFVYVSKSDVFDVGKLEWKLEYYTDINKVKEIINKKRANWKKEE